MPLSRAAAAASALTPSGTYAQKSAGARQYSAYAPLACAVTTRSPTPQGRDVVADGFDGAAHLVADDERHLPRVLPGPEVGVEEVHADRLGLDQHLAGAGGRAAASRRRSGLRVRRSRRLRLRACSYPAKGEACPARRVPSAHRACRLPGVTRGRRGRRRTGRRAAQTRAACALAVLGRPGHARRRPGDPAGDVGLHRPARRVPGLDDDASAI